MTQPEGGLGDVCFAAAGKTLQVFMSEAWSLCVCPVHRACWTASWKTFDLIKAASWSGNVAHPEEALLPSLPLSHSRQPYFLFYWVLSICCRNSSIRLKEKRNMATSTEVWLQRGRERTGWINWLLNITRVKTLSGEGHQVFIWPWPQTFKTAAV